LKFLLKKNIGILDIRYIRAYHIALSRIVKAEELKIALLRIRLLS